MAVVMAKKTFVNVYLQKADTSIVCYPFAVVNPDTFDKKKMLKVINSLEPCIDSSFLIQSVKKVEGYKLIKT